MIHHTWKGDGLSPGSLVVGGSGSAGPGDTPFDGIAASSVITIDASGPRSPQLKHAQGAGVACAHYWNITSQNQGANRFYFTTPAAWPASSFIINRLQSTGGTVLVGRLDIGADGSFRLRNGTSQLDASSAGLLSLATRYRIESTMLHNGASGVFTARAFLGDGSTALDEIGASADFGSAHDRVWYGQGNTSPQVGDVFYDDFAVSDTNSWIGAALIPVGVVVTSTAYSFDYGTTVTLTGTPSDGDGSATHLWSIQGGPNTSTSQLSSTTSASPVFNPVTSGSYLIRDTVTDSTGTAFDEKTLVVTGRLKFQRSIVISG